MANYVHQYRCEWDSDEGTQWRLDFYQLNGARHPRPRMRALGKGPVLKREQNDNVWGSSLEVFLQCDDEGAYDSFYTSDPMEWQVVLRRYEPTMETPDWVDWWTGYLVPELYSAPLIGVPYDVQVIATDGLGELKRHDFHAADVVTAYGMTSVRTVLDYLLNLTGLGYDVNDDDECPLQLSSFVDVATGVQMLDTVFDPSFMDGETCYDVLQAVLRSLNAVVFRRVNRWWLVRETDTVISEGRDVEPKPITYQWVSGFKTWHGVTLHEPDLSDYYGSTRLGIISNVSRGLHYFWPLGHLDEEIIPAARKVVVVNDYKLDAGRIVGDPLFRGGTATSWLRTTGTKITTAGAVPSYVAIPGGLTTEYVFQSLNIGHNIRGRFKLNIKALGTSISTSGTDFTVPVHVQVNDSDSTKVLGLDSSGQYMWKVPGTAGFTSGVELRLSAQDKVELLQVDFDDLPQRFSIRVNGGVYNRANLRLYEVSIGVESEKKGMKAIVEISNNARNDAAEVELPLNSGLRDDYILHTELLTLPSGLPFAQVRSSKITASKLIEFIALDRTLQVAKPRVKLKGTLMTRASSNLVKTYEPVAFSCNMGGGTTLYFLTQSYSWDLLNDEMEVELLSVPDASIVISDYSVTTAEE